MPVVLAPSRSVGRNESCPCGSGKKYKKCCLESNRQQQEELRNNVATYQPSEKMRALHQQLSTDFKPLQFQDITPMLNNGTYMQLQMANVNNVGLATFAERTETTQALFKKKTQADDMDVIVMYRGAYRVFRADMYDKYVVSLQKFLEGNGR